MEAQHDIAVAMAAESDAQRGERDGRTRRRLGLDVPSLSGGAYAVGFLYGYSAEARPATEGLHRRTAELRCSESYA
jgi:hypothetical protein